MKLRDYTDIIISYLEGGYYHPNMKSKLKNGNRMGNSGETMFGLDRVNGTPSVSTFWNPFWELIDKWYADKHADITYYNDKADGKNGIPSDVGNELRKLATQEMTRRFEYYIKNQQFKPEGQQASEYLSESEKNYIYTHPSILLNMYYAAWGGSERFKQLESALHEVLQTTQDEEQVWQALQKKRIEVGATQSAKNLETARQALPEKINTNWWGWTLALIGAGVFYLILKK